MTKGFIPPHGGYEALLSYQRAEVVYDATVAFCAAFFDKRDRTVDQMIQAARSGKQNIVEGSLASATSKEMEIKLTNVARASLEELLKDYQDFLRTRQKPIWDKRSKEALYVRRLARGNGKKGRDGTEGTHGTHGTHGTYGTYGTHGTHGTHGTDGTDGTYGTYGTYGTHELAPHTSHTSPTSPTSHTSHQSHPHPPRVTFATFRPFFETRPPEVLANIVICLIHQANYLLDQQLRRLEQEFLEQGGLRERMTRARLERRQRHPR
jgi:four helix bundle suffix protein